jgi:hypothetical protein
MFFEASDELLTIHLNLTDPLSGVQNIIVNSSNYRFPKKHSSNYRIQL